MVALERGALGDAPVDRVFLVAQDPEAQRPGQQVAPSGLADIPGDGNQRRLVLVVAWCEEHLGGVERDAPNVDAGSVGEEPRVATEPLRQRFADDLCSLQHAHPVDQRTAFLA